MNNMVNSREFVIEKEIVMPKFNRGDIVRLNDLGKSNRALGNKEYRADPCDKLLLAGEALRVSNVVPMFQGSRYFSLHFYDGSYSYSEDFFELAE
ncbi:MAG: hypothetical protein Q8P17_03515 [bacterium]|nr:hypothetical protein [bacterium]